MPAARRYPQRSTERPVYAPRRRSPVSEAIADAAVADVDLLEPFPVTPLPGGPSTPVVVSFSAPSTPLSVNATNGRHHGTYALDKRLWAAAGRDVAMENASLLERFRGHRVELTFCLPLVQWRRADSPNFASGVSVKACVDSIVKTGLLVPDDRSEWLEVGCVFWGGGPSKDEVRLRVRTAEPPWDGSDHS